MTIYNNLPKKVAQNTKGATPETYATLATELFKHCFVTRYKRYKTTPRKRERYQPIRAKNRT